MKKQVKVRKKPMKNMVRKFPMKLKKKELLSNLSLKNQPRAVNRSKNLTTLITRDPIKEVVIVEEAPITPDIEKVEEEVSTKPTTEVEVVTSIRDLKDKDTLLRNNTKHLQVTKLKVTKESTK